MVVIGLDARIGVRDRPFSGVELTLAAKCSCRFFGSVSHVILFFVFGLLLVLAHSLVLCCGRLWLCVLHPFTLLFYFGS